MTFRNLALATLLTSATALAAHAESGVTEEGVIKENGQAYEDSAMTDGDTATTVEKNVYSENGHEMVSVTAESMDPGEGTTDGIESRKTEALGTLTEVENILKAAEDGVMLRTADGEVVGTVAGTRDLGDEGNLVLVDVDPATGIDAKQVAFRVGTLSAIEEGPGLEYAATMKILRDYIAKQSS